MRAVGFGFSYEGKNLGLAVLQGVQVEGSQWGVQLCRLGGVNPLMEEIQDNGHEAVDTLIASHVLRWPSN